MNAWRNFDQPMIDKSNAPSLAGYFKNNYELKGKDWITTLPEHEQKAFLEIVRRAGDYGRKGGNARAQTAKRDQFGRFTKK